MKIQSLLNTPKNQCSLEKFTKVPVSGLLNPGFSYEPYILECTTGVNAAKDQTPFVGFPYSDTQYYTPEPHELYRIIRRDRRHEMVTRRGGRRGRPTREQRNGYLTPPPSVSPRPRRGSLSSTTYPYSSSPSPKPVESPHSNKPYTREQVDWIRYHHHDRGLKWPVCQQLYSVAFWGDTLRDSPQCMNSRFYRDNRWGLFDDDGEPILGNDGNQLMEKVKVRDQRRDNHLYDQQFPLSLIYKSPERVEYFRYPWILPEDMRQLEKHLRDIKMDPIENKKYLYRRSLLSRARSL